MVFPMVVLVVVSLMRAGALQTRNAHRVALESTTGNQGRSALLTSTASRSAGRVAAGQTNIFTDVLKTFDWRSASAASAASLAKSDELSHEKERVNHTADNDTAMYTSAANISVNATGNITVKNNSSMDKGLVGREHKNADTAVSQGGEAAEANSKEGVSAAAQESASAAKGDSDGIVANVEGFDGQPGTLTSQQSTAQAGAAGAKGGKELRRSHKKMHEVQWKEDLTSGVVFNRTARTCEVGQQHCKSFCRWLKLTDKDFDVTTASKGGCPLFDWSMESSGYTAPSARKLLVPEPVDCATDFLSRNVHRDDVGTYVLQLEECMVGLPQEDSEEYGVPLQVVANGIAGWKKEETVREGAALVELQLQAAIEQGRKAFWAKSNEAEAVGNLSGAMRKAKSVDGHYMIDDIRTSRELLEKLQPIVLARKGLADSEMHGRLALEVKLERRVSSAILMLNVSIASAESMGIGEQAASAQHVRDDLVSMQEVMDQMQAALFQANVSARTTLHVSAAIERMNATMARAKAANITTELPEGHRLVVELKEISGAKDTLKDAANRARAALDSDDHGRQGLADFLEVMHSLREALAGATRLHLTSRVTAEAVRMMASLEESKAARQALRTATFHGHAVVLDPSTLNFTSENAAIGELSGAVSWAEHARLEHGMPIARELLKMLSALRDAKVRMTNALAVGGASLRATAGEEDAIEVLSRSLREAKALNMTAGTFRAKEQLRSLRQQVDARDALEDAVGKANETLRTKAVQPTAVSDLNASIAQATRSGLTVEVIVAQQQLERLGALKDALDDIHVAIEVNAPMRVTPQLASVSDHQRAVNVTVPQPDAELKVTDLPEVPGSRDDGDQDFEEHIRRLNRSIATAKHYGLVDPEMLEQVAQLQKLQDAWDMLNTSTQEGQAALKTRAGVYKASVHIEDAVRLAERAGLKVGVKKARHVVEDLLALPAVKNELEAAMLQGNISLDLRTGIHDALVRLNGALGDADRLGLVGKEKKAEKIRDALMSVNEAWLQLRAATVQGTVALRLEHGEDAAIDALEEAIEEAVSAGLNSETPAAKELLGELRHMNAAHVSIESAVVPDEE